MVPNSASWANDSSHEENNQISDFSSSRELEKKFNWKSWYSRSERIQHLLYVSLKITNRKKTAFFFSRRKKTVACARRRYISPAASRIRTRLGREQLGRGPVIVRSFFFFFCFLLLRAGMGQMGCGPIQDRSFIFFCFFMFLFFFFISFAKMIIFNSKPFFQK